MKLIAFLKRIGSDNSGATAVEYGLIASLIVIASISAFNSVADQNTRMWDVVEAAMESANER